MLGICTARQPEISIFSGWRVLPYLAHREPARWRNRRARRNSLLLAAAVFGFLAPAGLYAQVTGTSTDPSYTAQSIVNGATQTEGPLAPNAIATLYGSNLAFSTYAVTNADLVGGSLPTSLDGVGVWINGSPCGLFLISPTQINFLVPSNLSPGTVSLLVARQGIAGPGVSIQLDSASPGLFLWNGNNAVGVHLNGQVISATAPAAAGEIIVIYAAGLGSTAPETSPGQLATAAAPIVAKSQFQVLLNGVALPAGSVLYVGLTPGFAGLYQVNLQLPAVLPGADPQIQIAVGAQLSPAGVQIMAQ